MLRPDLDRVTEEYDRQRKDIQLSFETDMARVDDLYSSKITSLVPASPSGVNQMLKEIGLHGAPCHDYYVAVRDLPEYSRSIQEWITKRRRWVEEQEDVDELNTQSSRDENEWWICLYTSCIS